MLNLELLKKQRVVEAPFKHLILDGLWDHDFLFDIKNKFPAINDPGWFKFKSSFDAGKMQWSDPSTLDIGIKLFLKYLASQKICELLEDIFGIKNLVPSLYGGGLHCSPRGAKLEMHTDFSQHPDTHMYRRLNLLVYLNELVGSGGCLILGKDNDLKIQPVFNRTVIFESNHKSVHGHPDLWDLDEPRRSIAMYYFSPEPPDDFVEHQGTVWLGGNSA